jgi:hypothetical protein
MTRPTLESGSGTRWSSTLRHPSANPTLRFITMLAVANAPFWVLSQNFFMSRAFINVDLALAICVLCVSLTAGIALLCIGWCGDLILSQSLTFHFRSPLEFVQSLQYASALDLQGFASWDRLLLILPFLASAIAVAVMARGQRRLWRPALVLTLLLVGLDATNGSSMLSKRDNWRIGFNLAGSPWSTLGSLALKSKPSASSPLRAIPLDETAQGLVDIPAWAGNHPGRSVLFVLVESMGLPQSTDVRQWLSQQLVDDQVKATFDVLQADLPFRGSTTSGELRAMCAMAGSFGNLDAATGANCLPSRLAALGWQTIGMHGFSQRMFDRETWWPLIGLQSTHFVNAPEFGNVRCGAAFRGGCDDRLIDAGVQALRPGNRFVYLLTLNTHLPAAATDTSPQLKSICERQRQDADACNLVSQLGGVLGHLRASLRTQKPAPLVVVVGDHAPPFSAIASRQAFQLDRVPAFVLLPRE